MPQSRTLDVGLDGHQASIAVAAVATAHDAEVIALGTLGTRRRPVRWSPTHGSQPDPPSALLAPALPLAHLTKRTSSCSTRTENFYASS
jgi:hypothetical protein